MTSIPSARGPEPPSSEAIKARHSWESRDIPLPDLLANIVMISEQQLRASTDAFFDAFSSNNSPLKMLSFFSTTSPVIIQHAPATCTHPHTSRLDGSNAIRSYFDVLATHFTRSDAKISSPLQIDVNKRRANLTASVTWKWKKSGRKFVEEFTWTLDYDEGLRIVSFVIRTVSGPGTCVMRAIDTEPASSEKAVVQASVSSQAPKTDFTDTRLPISSTAMRLKPYSRHAISHLHRRRALRVLGFGQLSSNSSTIQAINDTIPDQPNA